MEFDPSTTWMVANESLATSDPIVGGSWNDVNDTIYTSNPFYFYEKEQFTVLWMLLASILVGNSAVILALVLSKGRKSRTNFFIMHLAVADLLVGLVSVLTDIIWKITISWNAGNVACKLVRFSQGLVTYLSTYVLVALSIDRYNAIIYPMRFSGSWSRAKILIKCAWLVSALFASPSMFLFKEKQVNGMPQCWMELSQDWHWQLYMCLVSIAILVVPTIIILICYSLIIHTIWSKSKLMVMTASSSRSTSKTEQFGGELRRASSRGLIPKAKIKTVKMTLVIVSVFVLCWAPYIVFDLLQVFGQIPHSQTNIAIATLIQSLAPLNSAANPIIYCLFSTHICSNLRRIRVIDQLANLICPCWKCTELPPDARAMYQRAKTDGTTMSNISSRKQHSDLSKKQSRYAITKTTFEAANYNSQLHKKSEGNIELVQPTIYSNPNKSTESLVL